MQLDNIRAVLKVALKDSQQVGQLDDVLVGQKVFEMVAVKVATMADCLVDLKDAL